MFSNFSFNFSKSMIKSSLILFILWIRLGFSKIKFSVFLSKRLKIKSPETIISFKVSRFVVSSLYISPKIFLYSLLSMIIFLAELRFG